MCVCIVLNYTLTKMENIAQDLHDSIARSVTSADQ